MWSKEAKGVPDLESQKRCIALMFNGKLHQSGEYCSGRSRIDWLEGQRQDQDELHMQDCNRACQHEIQTWNPAARPCVCCKILATIARPLGPDLPDVRSHNVTMVRVRMRKDVLNEIVSVLIACNLSRGQQCHDRIIQRTYYRSAEYEADPPVLHKHARDSALGSQGHQS